MSTVRRHTLSDPEPSPEGRRPRQG
jgi:hypothetical protein